MACDTFPDTAGAGIGLTRREAHLERQGPRAPESDTATIRSYAFGEQPWYGSDPQNLPDQTARCGPLSRKPVSRPRVRRHAHRTPVGEGGATTIGESGIDRGGTSTSRLHVNLDFRDGPTDVSTGCREESGWRTGWGFLDRNRQRPRRLCDWVRLVKAAG